MVLNGPEQPGFNPNVSIIPSMEETITESMTELLRS